MMREKKYKALRSLAYLYVLMDEMFDGIGFENVKPIRNKFFEVASALCGAGACIAIRREIMLYRKAFEELYKQEESEEK